MPNIDQSNSSYFNTSHFERVLFCKADMDTCLAALILGVAPFDTRSARVVGKASAEALSDRYTLCVECGGSGEPYRGNFDHHDTRVKLPPACHQAFRYTGIYDQVMERLVHYVCAVDIGPYPHIRLPNLSALFSGMMLVESNPLIRFSRGIEMLQDAYTAGWNPFEILPLKTNWRIYLEAKLDNIRKLAADKKKAVFYLSHNKIKVGFLSSRHIGGTGFLYTRGCLVALLHNPSFGTPPMVKYTIAGNGHRVNHLLPYFNAMEPGWGGTPYIISSPFTGTTLRPSEVLAVVLRYV